MVKPGLLIFVALTGLKPTSVILYPATGHVLSDFAVGFTSCVEPQFGPVIEAGHASSHQQHGDACACLVDVSSFRNPAMGVVVVQEGHELVGMGVQKISARTSYTAPMPCSQPSPWCTASCMAKCHASPVPSGRPRSSSNPVPSTRAACLAEPYTHASANMNDSGNASAMRLVMAAMASCAPYVYVSIRSPSMPNQPSTDVGSHVAVQSGLRWSMSGIIRSKPSVVECRFIGPLSVWVDDHAAAVVGAFRFVEAS